MPELAMNNPFGFFVPRRSSSTKITRKNNSEAIVPTQPKVQEYRDSGYYLDSISELARNQSLTLEQIAKSQTKTIIEEINALPSKYEISNFEEVKNFLSKNRFLISLIEEIPSKIYQYFGNGQKLALQILYEPDFPESSELWILVLTELPAKEARSVMNRFDKDWWLKNLHKTNYKLNIGIEYV
jgi:hypothetical protein